MKFARYDGQQSQALLIAFSGMCSRMRGRGGGGDREVRLVRAGCRHGRLTSSNQRVALF